jgi:hypothetical protein
MSSSVLALMGLAAKSASLGNWSFTLLCTRRRRSIFGAAGGLRRMKEPTFVKWRQSSCNKKEL